MTADMIRHFLLEISIIQFRVTAAESHQFFQVTETFISSLRGQNTCYSEIDRNLQNTGSQISIM